jgi:hypothetical protein
VQASVVIFEKTAPVAKQLTFRFGLISAWINQSSCPPVGSSCNLIIGLYNRQNAFYFERTTGKRIKMLRFFPSLIVTLEFLP